MNRNMFALKKNNIVSIVFSIIVTLLALGVGYFVSQSYIFAAANSVLPQNPTAVDWANYLYFWIESVIIAISSFGVVLSSIFLFISSFKKVSPRFRYSTIILALSFVSLVVFTLGTDFFTKFVLLNYKTYIYDLNGILTMLMYVLFSISFIILAISFGVISYYKKKEGQRKRRAILFFLFASLLLFACGVGLHLYLFYPSFVTALKGANIWLLIVSICKYFMYLLPLCLLFCVVLVFISSENSLSEISMSSEITVEETQSIDSLVSNHLDNLNNDNANDVNKEIIDKIQKNEEIKTIICPSCGDEVPSKAAFCVRCGCELGKVKSELSSETLPTNEKQVDKTNEIKEERIIDKIEPQKGGKKITIIIRGGEQSETKEVVIKKEPKKQIDKESPVVEIIPVKKKEPIKHNFYVPPVENEQKPKKLIGMAARLAILKQEREEGKISEEEYEKRRFELFGRKKKNSAK